MELRLAAWAPVPAAKGAHHNRLGTFLDEEEATRVITGYERRNWFIAPIIRAVLSHLLGWPYDGLETARRRLVAQLPLVAFRPANHSK